ncbi:MAG: SPOR domain-containing protein [Magnetococcales bacterium]|nr:SPOR domain-containing protein [Magnetococcales bacterium]
MNPRYPTSRQFRRHTRTRKLGRPLLLLGLAAGVALYWIFSSSPAPRKPEPTPVAESKALEEEISAHLKTTQSALSNPPSSQSRKDKEKEKTSPEPGDGRRLAVIDHPSLTDPTSRLEAPETPAPSELAATSRNFTPVPVQGKKPSDGAKTGDVGKNSENAKNTHAKSPENSKSGHDKEPPRTSDESADKTAKVEEDSSMPSAPKDLAPKAKPPDLDMTFYRELPKRKVVVPMEEPVENVAGKPTPAANPPATGDKSATRTGPFVVQLAVFNDAPRADAMVADLKKRGIPARVVKSREGNLYRVRLGPFPSHAEATRSLTQWKLGGQSALIFQDNEG